jgi:predicted RNA-binding protein with PUA-like domain
MKQPPQHWLVKSEPGSYSWAQFVEEKRAAWTGVRSFQARNNLRGMRVGDRVLFYHSVTGKEIVGIAEVAAPAYPDPTATEGEWSCADLTPLKALPRPVTLAEIKANPAFREIALVRYSRLSVVPLTAEEYDLIVQIGTGSI